MTGSHRAEPTPAGTTPAAGTPERTPEELRGDLGELRAELGDTVEELTHRADVPGRVRAKREETAERVQEQVAQAREVIAQRAPEVRDTVRERPALLGGIALVLSYLLVGRLRRRRRARTDPNTRTRRKDGHGTR
jgi:hypothetical protein